MLKLNYHISQETSLDKETVIDLIVTELKNRKYRVINYNRNEINFDIDPWRWTSRSEGFGRMSGGQFKINVLENSGSIILDCYFSVAWPIILIAGLSIIMLFQGLFGGILIFFAFFSFGTAIDFTAAKSNMREILRVVS